MNTNFKVLGLTRLGIKPESTAPEADTLISRPFELCKPLISDLLMHMILTITKCKSLLGSSTNSLHPATLTLRVTALQSLTTVPSLNQLQNVPQRMRQLSHDCNEMSTFVQRGMLEINGLTFMKNFKGILMHARSIFYLMGIFLFHL